MPAGTRGGEAGSGAFKDHLDHALVERLAMMIAAVDRAFPVERFLGDATAGLEELELKARVAHIAAALNRCLPGPFDVAAEVVTGVVDLVDRGEVPVPADPGWELWPLPQWVALAGREQPAVALELLARLTRYATGEFAVRPFIDDDPAATLDRFRQWVGTRDEHVRRLVSEGTRPRLPWAPRLAIATVEPDYAVPLLDQLVDDPSEFVRRSVSNHLNDLCRVDRSLGLAVAGQWSDRAAAAEPEVARRLEWVVRRGLRSLVKEGDAEALRPLGHDPAVAVVVEEFAIVTDSVVLGEAAEWQVVLVSEEPAPHRVVVDYAIHFVGANGRVGRKVFKWATFELAPGERRVLQRRHVIRPITTRTYRSGRHRVEVQVNGSVVASGVFELEVPGAE